MNKISIVSVLTPDELRSLKDCVKYWVATHRSIQKDPDEKDHHKRFSEAAINSITNVVNKIGLDVEL